MSIAVPHILKCQQPKQSETSSSTHPLKREGDPCESSAGVTLTCAHSQGPHVNGLLHGADHVNINVEPWETRQMDVCSRHPLAFCTGTCLYLYTGVDASWRGKDRQAIAHMCVRGLSQYCDHYWGQLAPAPSVAWKALCERGGPDYN